MIKGNQLSDVLKKERPAYQRGRLNLICAQTGQGKTTAAIHTIPEQLGIEPQRCLILIDTIMGEEEKISMNECQEWGEKLDKPYILNYQKFAAMVKRGEIIPSMFDYIACDEIHNLIKYVRIDEATIWRRNPESSRDVICLLLSHESLSYVAIDTLFHWAELQGIWWFGLTATPANLEKWSQLKGYINEIQTKEQMLAYEVFQKYEYTDVKVLLRANPEVKRLIFAPTIEMGLQFAEEIESSTPRNTMVLWSRNSKQHKLSTDQLQAIDHLQTQHKYPPGLDDIIMTEAYATGWNLMDENVQIVIVHSGNKDIQIQFPGRKRGDWQIQYNYNSQLAESEKRQARRLRAAEANKQTWIVPEHYLNRRLTKSDKDELIAELGYPKKWTSLKKELEANYVITQTGTGVNYGHVIVEKL